MDRTDSPLDATRPGSAVAIGNFDGVHRGHRMLVAHAIDAAAAEGLRSVVLTFDRHPATVVRPGRVPRLITSVEQKLELLRATGVDEVAVLVFDEERADETAEDFVRSVLVDELGADVVVVGASFRFGRGQGGDVALLETMGRELGFRVIRVELVADDLGDGNDVVSSSRVRALISSGKLAEATRLLGRPHEVRATEGLPSRATAAGRLVFEVSPEILLPPVGSYEGEVAAMAEDGSGPGAERWSAAEITVLSPTELVVVPAGDPGADGDDASRAWPPLAKVIAVRFLGPADLHER